VSAAWIIASVPMWIVALLLFANGAAGVVYVGRRLGNEQDDDTNHTTIALSVLVIVQFVASSGAAALALKIMGM
jgi:hypothetical protein